MQTRAVWAQRSHSEAPGSAATGQVQGTGAAELEGHCISRWATRWIRKRSPGGIWAGGAHSLRCTEQRGVQGLQEGFLEEVTATDRSRKSGPRVGEGWVGTVVPRCQGPSPVAQTCPWVAPPSAMDSWSLLLQPPRLGFSGLDPQLGVRAGRDARVIRSSLQSMLEKRHLLCTTQTRDSTCAHQPATNCPLEKAL